MVTAEIIEEVKNRLVEAYKPMAIYLFGSYAWGHPDEDSDLDVLIVLEKYTKDQHSTMVDGHSALRKIGVPKDILVYDKTQWEYFSSDHTTFCYKIKQEGKLLYGKA